MDAPMIAMAKGSVARTANPFARWSDTGVSEEIGSPRTARTVEAYMYRNILVPIDGTEPARAALLEVVNIAADRARLVRLFHVVDIWHRNGDFSDGSVGDIVTKSLREVGQKLLAEGREVLSQHGVDCDAILVESHGEPAAHLILAHATEWPANLIVMGTHGRKGLTRLVLGSDAAEVVRAAPVPVLLVREIPISRSKFPAESERQLAAHRQLERADHIGRLAARGEVDQALDYKWALPAPQKENGPKPALFGSDIARGRSARNGGITYPYRPCHPCHRPGRHVHALRLSAPQRS